MCGGAVGHVQGCGKIDTQVLLGISRGLFQIASFLIILCFLSALMKTSFSLIFTEIAKKKEKKNTHTSEDFLKSLCSVCVGRVKQISVEKHGPRGFI